MSINETYTVNSKHFYLNKITHYFRTLLGIFGKIDCTTQQNIWHRTSVIVLFFVFLFFLVEMDFSVTCGILKVLSVSKYVTGLSEASWPNRMVPEHVAESLTPGCKIVNSTCLFGDWRFCWVIVCLNRSKSMKFLLTRRKWCVSPLIHLF